MKPQMFFGSGNRYHLRRMKEEGIGRVLSGQFYSLRSDEPWLFDNGAWGAFVKGVDFPDDLYRRRLDRLCEFPDPYLSVCPDIVMGGMASLDFSMRWMEILRRDHPISWYLAVQDGMYFDAVESVKNDFDGIFIGGSTVFKSTIPIWQTLGLPIHYGRCGTRRKLSGAMAMQVNSLDSSSPIIINTKIQGEYDYFESFIDLYNNGDPQIEMFGPTDYLLGK